MAKLNGKKRYLQIALNGDLADAQKIIARLPASDRIIIEAGTPLIKEHGITAVSRLNYWWQKRLDSAKITGCLLISAILVTIAWVKAFP